MRFILLSILLLSLWASSAQAQTARLIHGHVYGRDEAKQRIPLVAARVQQLGSQRGALTDAEGHFMLTLDPVGAAKLVVSYVGLRSDTVAVTEGGLVIELATDRAREAVEITARNTGRTISALTAQQTEILTPKELGKAACCNLGESFETNPSVDVSYADPTTGARQIQLLGLAGAYTDVLVDGLPLLSGLGRSFGLSYVPGPWVQSIEIAKGPGSVAQGYESIAGLVNISLKRPDRERTHLNAYINQFGRTEVNGVFSGDVGKYLEHTTFAHASTVPRLNTDAALLDVNGDGFLDLPYAQQINIGERFASKDGLGPWHVEAGINLMLENRSAGQAAFLHQYDSHALYQIEVRTRRLSAQGRVGYLFAGKPYQSVGLQWGFIRHHQESTYGLRGYEGDQTRAQANLIFQSIIGTTDHAYRIGLSYTADAYDERVALPNQLDVRLRRRESVPGAFAEYTFSHLDTWLVTLGVRADAHNLFGSFVTPRLHVKYSPTKTTTLRAQLGQGRRTANPIADNPAVLPTSRLLIVSPGLRMERAWNAGFNVTQQFKLFGREGSLGADLYHTRFENQVVADYDRLSTEVYLTNLDGQSYATALQLEADYELAPKLDIRLAWKRYDVRTSLDGRLQERPMVPQQRALVNLAYTPLRWKFDATASYTGTQRIPSNKGMPTDLRRPERSPDYAVLHAQVTRVFRKFDLYLGGENLLGFRQADPLVDPMLPFGPHFDSAMAWGPTVGRVIYLGIRYSVL